MNEEPEWRTDQSGRKYRMIRENGYLVKEYEPLYSRSDGLFTETQVKESKRKENQNE